MQHIYCIELLFEGIHPEIQEKVKNLGDEIIFLTFSEYTKLHIHSKNYQEILDTVKDYNILKQKIDDNIINF